MRFGTIEDIYYFPNSDSVSVRFTTTAARNGALKANGVHLRSPWNETLKVEKRKEDLRWRCKSCNYNNYASRKICHQCGTNKLLKSKPAEVEESPQFKKAIETILQLKSTLAHEKKRFADRNAELEMKLKAALHQVDVLRNERDEALNAKQEAEQKLREGGVEALRYVTRVRKERDEAYDLMESLQNELDEAYDKLGKVKAQSRHQRASRSRQILRRKVLTSKLPYNH